MIYTFKKSVKQESVALEFINDRSRAFMKEADGRKALVFGAGTDKKSRKKTIIFLRQIISVARSYKISRLSVDFSKLLETTEVDPEELAELMAVNFGMANFQFVLYKNPPKEGWNFVEEVIVTDEVSKAVRAAIARGSLIAEEVNATRTLANTPGGEMTPSILAAKAQEAAKGTGLKVKILGKAEIKKLKMGGLLGVSQGSSEEPKFIVMEHKGGKNNEAPIVFVGKGVTFDTGGLNLKPSDKIYEMHLDMSGGAAVIHALVLMAKLKLKRNCIGLVPAVENMPSGSSYRPGDVLKMMSGKTVEVIDTDAEGRIILADSLTYAERYKPSLVVDVATLTGAAVVALGQHYSALFTKESELEDLFRSLGEQTGDYVWPLPLGEEYENEMKGKFADLANLGKYRGLGGASTAAAFLSKFADKYPWVHLDIAPCMTSVSGDFLCSGATGVPVRLLVELADKYKPAND